MLFEVVTIELHYMTDRQERYDIYLHDVIHLTIYLCNTFNLLKCFIQV